MSEKKTRNILNLEDLEKYAVAATGWKDTPNHIKVWWASTFRRYLIQEASCVGRPEIRSHPCDDSFLHREPPDLPDRDGVQIFCRSSEGV